MSELAAAVDASETLWTVDEVPDPAFGFYTVGSEIVQVIAGFPESLPGYAVGESFPAKIRVIRATNGTTAATHADGVALTAANAFAGGGGGLDVTDGVVTVAGATELLLPPGTVIDEGAGVAFHTGGFIASDTDPGAVGAGVVWKDISGGVGVNATWWERNAEDDGWMAAVNPRVVAVGDALADAATYAETSGAGVALADSNATANGDGGASANSFATANGDGDASAISRATSAEGAAFVSLLADRYNVKAGMSAVVDGTSARMAFNDTTPIAKPVVPLTAPDAQDVIDALVALGLIAQSD